MTDRLAFLWPQIILFGATCVVMVLGLSRSLRHRKLCAPVCGLALIGAAVASAILTPSGRTLVPGTGQEFFQALVPYSKTLIALIGLLMLPAMAGTVDRRDEEAIASGKASFDPLRSNRAEFYAFYLFSLTGLMLCADADGLIWLFLALELTSLPTYIMVAISSAKGRAREAAVKYFFLGALGAAFFLYGFALIYGGTGETKFQDIHTAIGAAGLNSITLAGFLLSILGIAFKIAAVPMHFYTPDVYQGSAPQVSAFLAFTPKTAGFLSLILLCGALGWSYGPGTPGLDTDVIYPGEGTDLPQAVRVLLWVMAALTMTVGNVLALLQGNVKRVLAYSSVAHSGYMLVGIIAGPGATAGQQASFTSNGIAAVLFYLTSYGVMNLGAFAVLAALEKTRDAEGEPREVESFEDIRGLCRTHPNLGWALVICSLSLLGFPPLLGFLAKLPLFTSGIAAGEIPLVVVLGINSAIGAVYYLRLAFLPFLESPDSRSGEIAPAPFRGRTIAALISAGGAVVLPVATSYLAHQIVTATKFTPAESHTAAADRAPTDAARAEAAQPAGLGAD